MRKQLISFVQVIKFCKISSSRGGVQPQPPLAYALGWSNASKIGINITNCYQNLKYQYQSQKHYWFIIGGSGSTVSYSQV